MRKSIYAIYTCTYAHIAHIPTLWSLDTIYAVYNSDRLRWFSDSDLAHSEYLYTQHFRCFFLFHYVWFCHWTVTQHLQINNLHLTVCLWKWRIHGTPGIFQAWNVISVLIIFMQIKTRDKAPTKNASFHLRWQIGSKSFWFIRTREIQQYSSGNMNELHHSRKGVLSMTVMLQWVLSQQ